LARPCYLGVDIGRRRDLTVLWLLEVEDAFAPAEARRFLTRAVLTLQEQPFAAQRQALDAFLALRLAAEPELRGDTFLQKGFPRTPSQDSYGNASDPLAGSGAFRQKVLGERENTFAKRFSRISGFAVRRCAIDATGLGLMLAEELQARWGARVEPVTFTLGVKEDLAVRVKRLLEERRLKLPYDPAVRAALGAVKRYVTPAGNVRFDADRTERAPHADHFWALALALAAADDSGPATDFISTSILRPSAQIHVY
jgi:phage FluMu gp28-like protein